MMITGLELLRENEFNPLKNRKVALLCNQASITREFMHAIDLFLDGHRKGIFKLKALLGPQHGLWGQTQDNMIEWQSFIDSPTGLPVYSLYSEHRKPTTEMLADLNVLVIDLQDIGARYYTFIWTMALCMKAAMEQGIELIVLDRPNPLGGIQMEGPLLDEDFRSFVGLYPLPIRHGLTIGEIASYFKEKFIPDCYLNVIPMKGWQREFYFDDTGLPWGMPSPNMPSLDTALVYPGLCLLESTNLSEGRGTTRPFEIFGAPWIEMKHFTQMLNGYELPGVHFRPIQFQPTFNKYKGQNCQGCFIHVTDRLSFKPFLTGLAIIREAIKCYPDKFHWKNPPYEYEYENKPFDILVGNGWLRRELNRLEELSKIEARWQLELKKFTASRQKYLLY